MSTPAKSFEDLRSILGKLDRKIDSARSRRLGLDDKEDEPRVRSEGPVAGQASPADEPELDSNGEPQGQPQGRSPFGRAKPLNRNGLSGPAGNTWIGGGGVG